MVRGATPAVSIVLPCRDGERHLEETLACVEAQTWRDWELLFVDDGSRDASAAVARRRARRDPERIRCLRHPGGACRGAFASRLMGARRARSSVIALLDADDLWEPDYLRRHLRLWGELKGTEVGLSYGPARYWFPDEPGRDFIHPMPSLAPAVFPPGGLLQNFLSSGYATMPRTSCSLLRRQAVLELAALAPAARRAPLCEDLFLMWGAASRWPVAVHPGAWVRYRQRCPLAERPRAYLAATWRDELAFLRFVRRHPRLFPNQGPGLLSRAIPARLAALRRAEPHGGYFFSRIPEYLRRLALAR